MATEPTNDNQIFYQYVLKTMNAGDFNTLPKQLGESSRMVTMRLKDPRAMQGHMVFKIAKLLNREVEDLMNEFELGLDGMTAGEYRIFKAAQEK